MSISTNPRGGRCLLSGAGVAINVVCRFVAAAVIVSVAMLRGCHRSLYSAYQVIV